MANSKIGNYQVEFLVTGYTAPVRIHTHSIYVAPLTAPESGTPVADIDVQLKGGGSNDLQSAADEYCSFLVNMYPSTLNLEAFTLWKYVTENVRDFVAAGTAVPATTGSGGVAIAQQKTLTYRTAGGSILKQLIIEGNVSGDNKTTLVPNATGGATVRMAAYVLSSASPVIGIDNTFPVAALFDSNGQNERVWRKVYRS